jgi:soluble lytic murein transglycosylase-like protein
MAAALHSLTIRSANALLRLHRSCLDAALLLAIRKDRLKQRQQKSALVIALAFWLGLPAAGASGTETSAPESKPEEGTAPRADPISFYRQIVERSAAQAGLPSEIADAVMAVESGYDPNAIGTSGEVGLMQILPSTARMMGFTGTLAELADPETNTHYGVAYLAQAWRLASKDLCTALMKYRAGHGETRFSVKSVDYCLAVRAKLIARHYPVTGQVPVASFGEPARPHSNGNNKCRPLCLAGSGAGLPDLGPLNKSLSEAVWQTRLHSIRGL